MCPAIFDWTTGSPNIYISFTDEGVFLVAEQIDHCEREKLGLSNVMRLRWVAAQHLSYLRFHRERFLASFSG